MRKIGQDRSSLWAMEVVITAVMTFKLLPVSYLYLMDFTAGRVEPDAEWALASATSVVALWLALLPSDSFFQRHSVIRWSVIVTVGIAIGFLARLAWGGRNDLNELGGSGMLVTLGPIALGIFQIVRLVRL